MRRKILVVDDEAHIRQVLSIKLRNAGYEALTAADGEEAFEVACAELPDLIITDFQMPFMTGLELCQALLEHGPTADTPVLLLTARGYSLGDEDLTASNIRDVLSKPFSPRAVLRQVESLLSEVDEGKRRSTESRPEAT